jgi:hypothetical protein
VNRILAILFVVFLTAAAGGWVFGHYLPPSIAHGFAVMFGVICGLVGVLVIALSED